MSLDQPLALTALHSAPAKSEQCGVSESPEDLLVTVWKEVAAPLSRLVAAAGLSADRVSDVLQDVYLTGLQQCPAGIGRDDMRRWLFRVTVNRCHLEHRRRRRWRTVWEKITQWWPIALDGRAEVAISVNEDRQLVREALQVLDHDLRTLLVLRYFNNLNSKEIAHILELPDATVRSRLRRARRLLADALKQMGYGDDNPL